MVSKLEWNVSDYTKAAFNRKGGKGWDIRFKIFKWLTGVGLSGGNHDARVLEWPTLEYGKISCVIDQLIFVEQMNRIILCKPIFGFVIVYAV